MGDLTDEEVAELREKFRKAVATGRMIVLPPDDRNEEEAAQAWCDANWGTLFGELGSYDFAREAFKAGWYARQGGDPRSIYPWALRKELGEDPL